MLDRQEADDRAVDLWAPLLAVAMVAEVEAGGDRTERLLPAAQDLSDAREADDEAGSAARLITALQRVTDEIGTAVTPGACWRRSRPGAMDGSRAPGGSRG